MNYRLPISHQCTSTNGWSQRDSLRNLTLSRISRCLGGKGVSKLSPFSVFLLGFDSTLPGMYI